MYAHQVVEDLKFLYNNGTEKVDKRYLAAAIKTMESSIKFSIGELGDFVSMFNGGESSMKVILTHKFDPPPYEETWVEYSWNDTRAGNLIFTSPDGNVYIFPFYWMPETKKKWFPDIHIAKFSTQAENSFGLQENPILIGDFINDISKKLRHLSFLTGGLYDLFCKILSCKNITTVDNPPPEKLNKKRAKKNKCPLFTYKTLVIKPTGKKQASQEAQGLWENRVHLCRGHFKTYTEENPLFGRLTGRYWWQPSVRGNKKKGVVMKDYKVEAA
jgi:hypothetical protein